MARIVFVSPDGGTRELDAAPGQSVMQIATAHLVPGIIGECGGELICATCHVFVDPRWSGYLPAMSRDEEDMLEVASEEPTKESRLSCQIVLTDSLDGIVVKIPRTQR